MIGMAAVGLQIAKEMTKSPAARFALCTAHTTVSVYLTHYSIKQSVASAKDTVQAGKVAAEQVRPQVNATLAKVKSLRPDKAPVSTIETNATASAQ